MTKHVCSVYISFLSISILRRHCMKMTVHRFRFSSTPIFVFLALASTLTHIFGAVLGLVPHELAIKRATATCSPFAIDAAHKNLADLHACQFCTSLLGITTVIKTSMLKRMKPHLDL
jgi:hypothetical protein